MSKIKLLLVGKGDSIFFTDYVRALKSCMDVEVDVYSPFADEGNYTIRPFDTIFFDDLEKKRIDHIKFISALIRPFLQRKRFANFLKRNNIWKRKNRKRASFHPRRQMTQANLPSRWISRKATWCNVRCVGTKILRTSVCVKCVHAICL